ncbi:amino acid ABC transporter permease [Rickettsiales bacterium LUAb2]
MSYINVLTSGWLQQLIYGSIVTIILTICAFSLGLTIALIFTFSKLANYKLVNLISGFYTGVVRGIPELLIIFLIFFVLSDLVDIIANSLQLNINAIVIKIIASIVALGLIEGCYLTEILRGGVSTIPYGQIEAAEALGMSKFNIFIRIVMPQLISYCWDGISNIWLSCIKDSSLIMVLGVTDLMFKANLAVTTTNMPFLFYGIAGAMYLLIAVISTILFKKFTPKLKKRLLEYK